MSITAIIVAAGQGARARGSADNTIAKQWRKIAGARVIDHTVRVFQQHPRIDAIVLVLHADDIDKVSDVSDLIFAKGGATRAASVHAGLEAAPSDTSHVLIHDVARPCVSAQIISDVIMALETHDAAAPALEVTDALWTGNNGKVNGTQDRTGLFRAQTPQGFAFEAIRAAHAAHAGDAADDVEVARAAGIPVAIVAGDEDNLKITLPQDFERAARILVAQKGTKDGY